MEKSIFFYFYICMYLLSFMNVLNKILVSSELRLFLVVRILIFLLRLDGLKLKVDDFYLKQKIQKCLYSTVQFQSNDSATDALNESLSSLHTLATSLLTTSNDLFILTYSKIQYCCVSKKIK
jgi:hypothetical protein